MGHTVPFTTIPHFGRLDFYREFLAIIPAEEGTKDVAIACPGVEFSVMELVEELDCQLYGRRKLAQGCLVSEGAVLPFEVSCDDKYKAR